MIHNYTLDSERNCFNISKEYSNMDSSLPPDYNYVYLPDDGDWKRFRIKDIVDKETVKVSVF